MFKPFRSPKLILGIIKKHETPKLDIKTRLFQIDTKRISFWHSLNLSPTEPIKREIFTSFHRRTSNQSVEVGNRDLFQTRDQTQNSRPDVTLQDSKKTSGTRAVAEAFEARKTVQASPTERIIPTSNMSSHLTKVLAKDACPRE